MNRNVKVNYLLDFVIVGKTTDPKRFMGLDWECRECSLT